MLVLIINHMEQSEELEYQIYKEYEILEKIGKGTYGVVYKARHKKSGRVVAIKKIIDAFQNLIDAKRTYRELNYLLQIDHPSIVRLQYLLHLNRKGLFNEPSTTRMAVPPFSQEERGATTDKIFWKLPQQVKHVYAVFQFIETDLACALKKCQELQPIQRKYIAYQLLQGIAYLHRSGLVHRDIKPSNILLNCSSLQVKICDFGMARLKVSTDGGNQGVLTEYVASRWYRPPQALLGITTCQDSIDLWSVGCVLAELVLKAPLFPGKSTLDQLELILKCIGMPSGKEIDRLSSEDAQFLLKNFSFSKRCRIKCLQETLSFCGNLEIDLIMNLLKFQPSQRISAEQALKHEYFSDIRHMNPDLQHYANFTTKILDFSLGTQGLQADKRSVSHPNIDHYRMLIDQLQKYAERSTNRSGNTFNHIHHQKQGQNIVIPPNFTKNQSNQEDKFKEKSTKESDFVTLNKHHYLSSTHSAIQNKEELRPQIEEKTKTVVDEGKVRRVKKGKVFSKAAELVQKSLMHVQKSEKALAVKKQQKKQGNEKVMKVQNKSRKALTVPKKGESLHKNQSSKQLMHRHQSPNPKQSFLLPKPAKKLQDKDTKSLISNKSSSSFHRPSKEKPSPKSNFQTSKSKIDPLKRFLKPSLALNKTTITKIKSSKANPPFKKNP